METSKAGGFKRAVKHESKLRLAFIGPSGSGKTFTALAVASALVPGGRVAVVDTERGSASKYADKFAFDVLEPETFDPRAYIQAIRDAEEAGYDVLVIDSLSHAWNGRGGALELVDQAAKRNKSGSSFSAWRDVTPLHQQMVDAMIGARLHIIATMRSKTEWVQEKNDAGKTVIRKVGLAPVQRDGLEYEFDVVGEIDDAHDLTVTKTRCSVLEGKIIPKPGQEFADTLREWLHGAAREEAPKRPKQEHAPAAPDGGSDGPAAGAAKATIEQVLAVINDAKTMDQLLQAGKLAATLPPNRRDVARKAYGIRSEAIAERARSAALVRDMMTAAPAGDRQKFIEALGNMGVLIPATDAIESLTDDELETCKGVVDEMELATDGTRDKVQE